MRNEGNEEVSEATSAVFRAGPTLLKNQNSA